MGICKSDNTVFVVSQLNDWSSCGNFRAPGSISDQSMWVGFVVDQVALKFSSEYISFLFPVSFHQRSELTCILVLHLQEGQDWEPSSQQCSLRYQSSTGYNLNCIFFLFPKLQVATADFSCSPPDLNFLDSYFMFMCMLHNHCHRTTAHLQLNK